MANTNKITIYLLKEGKGIEDALRDSDFSEIKLSDKKVLYYTQSELYKPKWVDKFFTSVNDLNLFNQNSKALLFSKVSINGEEKIFAIPFAYGHTMINKISCVEDFGLKLVLNISDRESIRKIGKRTLSSEPKNTIEQLSKIGEISDFGIDIEQDLIEEITARPKKKHQDVFSKNLVTGKVAFTISKEVNIDNLDDFLKICYEYYKKDDYKEDFGFIDQVKEVKENDFLNKVLIEKIKDNNKQNVKIWMAIPEIIKWEEVAGFSYTGKKEELFDDITYIDFKKSLTEDELENIDIEFLKRKKIIAFSNVDDKEIEHWSAYSCVYCEVQEKEKTYILTNSKWYEISDDFVKNIEDNYKEILDNSKGKILPSAKPKEHEDKYNERLAKSIPNAILMDRKNIRYGGGSSSIEFCDVYDAQNKQFIHVKNYYGSSALSHLFAQGRISGQLFLNDKNFREEAKKKERRLPIDPKNKPSSKDFKVVYGIITKSKNDLNLPFFSKVNLKNEKKFLEAFGFKEIYLVKIQREEE